MRWLMLYLLTGLLHSQIKFSSSFSSNPSSTPTQLCPHDQSFALLRFKSIFSFNQSASHIYEDKICPHSYPKMLDWEEGTDCCSWSGVTCDRVTGHLIGLDLSSSWLQGTIYSNSTLFLFTHLQSLNLACNNLYPSRISSQFGRFMSLTHLNLSSSVFHGQVPSEISYLSKLVSLDLSYNYNRPASVFDSLLRLDMSNLKKLLQNLTELRQLNPRGVNMSSVEVGSFENMPSFLTSLNLRKCSLQGKFPDSIFHQPNLQKLDLSVNIDLKVYFPKVNWSNTNKSLVLQSLSYLDLSFMNFLGDVPNWPWIGNLQSLSYLDLSNCNFFGFVPAFFGNLTKITHLDLSFNNFIGKIPPSLSNLRQLHFLSLSGNKFSGPSFPSFVVNLTHLVTLYLSNCKLAGPIPSHKLPNLNDLDLSFNSLNGTIPSWLFTLPSLVYLDLGYNQLSGTIPWSIFQPMNLTYLRLSSNNLSGVVEIDMFSKFINLRVLDLSFSSLSLSTNSNVNSSLPKILHLGLSSCNLSEFPNFLRTQGELSSLDLSNNRIHGQIPNWAFDMWKDSLWHLNLSSNLMTGVVQLPWENLQVLDLHSNLFEGTLPIPAPSTSVLSISNNKLTGEIPYSICNVSFLQILDLSKNNLSGIIPKCLGNFSNYLSVLDLRMNSFHGTIPKTFTKGNSLRNIALSGNQLNGSIPRSLIYCRYLEILDLRNNKINDTFPHWLETLPKLQVLILRSNKFHGPIKNSKAKHPFSKLRIFDLSYNDFSGPLPIRYIKNLKAMMNANGDKSGLKYMGDSYYQDSVMVTLKGVEIAMDRILTIFTTIDFSCNRFQGHIPKSIGKLCSLRGLNFSHNNLTGHIPSMLENLRKLEALDLSWNNISGKIPDQLASLTFLEVLNLSQNHLVGPIPRGKQFDTFQNDTYSGNMELCGPPLSKKCSGDDAPQPSSLIFHKESELVFGSGFGWRAVAIGYGCGMVFGLVSGCLMFLIGKPDWFVRIAEGKHQKKLKKANTARRHGKGRN
ncbi:hypothetical protein L1049_021913 [Liquidambar formosana]|uniref:Leucine-rich repeat-containing N-terminal plant-type domain-containing protein n=1 Tax=Liquidambar formosana TaxID=63359 RepID=A0AAP0RBM1_LIQFO